MISNLIIIVFSLVCIFQFTLVSASNYTDASTAFAELGILHSSLMSELTKSGISMRNEANQELLTLKNTTLARIEEVISDVDFKIRVILSHAEILNVSSRCQNDQDLFMGDFHDILIKRVQSCSERSSENLQSIFDQMNLESGLAGGSVMGCHSRAIYQCGEYNVDDSCYDFVIEEIEAAKVALKRNMDSILARTSNKFTAYKAPCWDLVESMMAIYPDNVVQHIKECVNLDIKLGLSPAC